MYYNISSQQQQQQQQQAQENTMNLLISPFEPDQYDAQQEEEGKKHHDECEYSNTQPLDVPMQQQQTNNYHGIDMFDPTSLMSPIVMPNHTYDQSPSPQLDLMNNFTNDFNSRSPESSSSNESQLVSPSHQYYPSSNGGVSDYNYSTNIINNLPTVGSWSDTVYSNNALNNLPAPSSQYNHHPAARRSFSVPPHFHKFKPSHQDNAIYNQLQVTHHPHHYQPAPKPLPIQIQRVNAQSNNTQQKPINAEAHRRQLDEKLEKINFDDITVAELKDMLRERGLSATGRKAELTNRLREEYVLLMNRGGAAAVNGAPLSPALSATGALHRRVANLNLDSPVQKNRQQRLYFPYSPPPTTRKVVPNTTRLASSVPDTHTPSYLNDQFMLKKKPSCLRKSIDDEQEQSRDWIDSFSAASPSSSFYHPSIPKIEETSNEFIVPPPSTDIWDDQTLQTFLNQI